MGFLGLLTQHVAKPLTVVLDNASIHTAKRIRPYVDLLKKQGLTLYFLPPYSPELNRIEKLWHKTKHTWMAVKCRNSGVVQFRPFSGNTGERERTAQAGGLESRTVELRRD